MKNLHISDDAAMVTLTDALRKRGLGLQLEVCHDEHGWFIIEKSLSRQAVKRYRDPLVLLDLLWSNSDDIWPLIIVEV